MSAAEVFADEPGRANLRVMTISHAVDDWMGELERQGKLPRTIDTYRRLLYKLADGHPRADVDELTPTLIRRFLDEQARRLRGPERKAPATIAQNVTIVNNFMDWLTREGLISRNPTRRNGDRIISRPKQLAPEENDDVVTVSSADVDRMIAAAARLGWKHRLAIHVLVGVGPRRKGASMIRVRDYDPEAATITFREKGGKTITKPIPDELHDVLLEALSASVYSSLDDYLIPSRGTPRRVERDDRAIWHLVKEIAEEADVDSHVHALRAAFAVHFLEAKPGEVVALQKLMGHRRIETTLVYLRRLDRRQAMETVRDVRWGGKSANSEESLEAKPGTEKEGFEPSFDPNALVDRARRQRALFVPGRGGQA